MSANDVIMTWQGLWTYYKSSLCSKEQREFILRSFSIGDALEVATPTTQIEIIEFAPDDVKHLPEVLKVLAPEVKRKFGLQNTRIVTEEGKARLKSYFS